MMISIHNCQGEKPKINIDSSWIFCVLLLTSWKELDLRRCSCTAFKAFKTVVTHVRFHNCILSSSLSSGAAAACPSPNMNEFFLQVRSWTVLVQQNLWVLALNDCFRYTAEEESSISNAYSNS
ncbi:unnamed protein product [Sphagnum tenellum]